MASFHSNQTDHLFDAILNLKTREDCYAFFEDLCTIKELKDMAQRLEVAYLLDSGMSYQKIVEKTGVSSATITRVNRCLTYGSGGYRSTIDYLPPKEDQP